MSSQVLLPATQPMDFSLQGDMSAPDGALDHGSLADSVVKKNIPKELTAHGTTPLGKPRLFVCNTCTRAFARLEHLRRHERSHTKEKPFTCGVCLRKFSRRDLLLRHAQKLHSGCSDAITRLRRKLIKSSSAADDYDPADDDFQLPYSRENGSTRGSPGPAPAIPTPLASHRGSLDSVLFNLNLFSARQKDLPTLGAPVSPARLSRSNSIKDSSLQKQLFDRKKSFRNRGASFSAQLGANYAQAVPELNDSYPADNVEFSTPQLLPTSVNEESSWLSNLSTIPGMADGFASSSGRINQLSADNEIPSHTSMFGMMRSDSVASNASLESAAAHPPRTSSINRNNSIAKTPMTPNGSTKSETKDVGELGYSFYDVPDNFPLTLHLAPVTKLHQPLSPIKQELEDELMELDNAGPYINTDGDSMLIPAAITNGVNFDLNFLNDIDELTQDYDVGSRFLPNGYSFYGDNPLVSSSGIESSTPPQLLASQQYYTSKGLQYHNQAASGSSALSGDPQLPDYDHQVNAPERQEELGFSRTKLFTKNMRHMIGKALSKYPISGIMSPTIPSNEKLEFFLNSFIETFLSHFPFIHPSKLNEHEIMNMTANEDPQNESARVCMPLLIATIGALMANNKNDSEHLYEASRRTIHIYLESRKNLVGDQANSGPSPSQTVNPLWLIQSLTLSVIYGLFSDNENNVYIVIRQLNALNSLVKTSIKSNRSLLFSINGEDEENYNAVMKGGKDNLELFQEIKFKNAINMQSQNRIVLMIYRLTNFILMMYNVPLTLSVNDIGSLALPDINDEFLWRFQSYRDFKQYLHSVENRNTLDFYLNKNETNTLIYRDLLMSLSKHEFDVNAVTHLSNLSKFGFLCVVQGIFEFRQYEEMKHIDSFSLMDNMTLFIDNSRNNVNSYYPVKADHEKLDYALLANFIKISSVVDFKFLKEQSWLRNYEELTKNFRLLLVSMEKIDEVEYIRVIDCCIVIAKLILFKTDETSAQQQQNETEIFLSEFQYLDRRSPSNFKALVNDSLQHQFNTSEYFEKLLNWTVYDEVDSSKHSLHSQMLFHVFTILAIFAVYVAKLNNPETRLGREANPRVTEQMNQRFIIVLRLLAKIENFLKLKYQNSKLDSEFTNLYLFLSNNNNELLQDHNMDSDKDGSMKNLLENHNYFAYSLEKSLYVLKVGELILKYLYDTSIKICIFKKLSGSISQIRKFMIDNEARLLA